MRKNKRITSCETFGLSHITDAMTCVAVNIELSYLQDGAESGKIIITTIW